MSSAAKVILWDFDGTLVSRPFMWTEAALSSLEDIVPGRGLTSDDISPHLQTGFPWHSPQIPHPELQDPDGWWAAVGKVFMDAFASFGFDESRSRQLLNGVRRHILDADRYRIFDDVVPALTELSELGWRHVVLSNHIPELEHLIEKLGIGGHFEFVVTSAISGFEKPHPGMFRHARDVVGSTSKLWMVGDNYAADVDGAESCGIPAILVRTEDQRCRRQARDLFKLRQLLEP